MRRNRLLATAAILSAAILSYSLAPGQAIRDGAGSAPGGWEYRVVNLIDVVKVDKGEDAAAAAVEAKFNELGRDGWDLATGIHNAVVFKRRKP